MSGGAAVFARAMTKAARPGEEIAPQALLLAVATHDEPLTVIADHDLGDEIFGAFSAEFDFLNFVRATDKAPTADNFDRLVALLRWLSREVANWADADDLQRKKFVALLVAIRSVEMGGNFWSALPDHIQLNTDFLAALERVIAGSSSTFTTRGLAPPIWEQEAVAKFQEADRNADWVGIADGWRLIEHGFSPSFLIVESVQGLNRFAPDRLLKAIAGFRQIVCAMGVAHALAPVQALAIGNATDNPYVEFAAAHRALSHRSPLTCPMDEAGRQPLTDLLVKVASDAARWKAWMRVFNRYPIQAMQPSLGSALAVVDDLAVAAFVESVELMGQASEGRQALAEGLRMFRVEAQLDRRRLLWKLAHERWVGWRFGQGDVHAHPTAIGYSELDYAIVGYALECVDDVGRSNAIRHTQDKLNAIDNAWYGEVTELISEWNRILSEFQPYAHASEVLRAGGDWLMEGKNYLPFDPQAQRYVVLRYWMDAISVRQTAAAD
ncbi:MAG TPA: hypothetical protein VNT30_09625 [Stellaceae bacterium]|nr:hypothetical protein [Stellaceae bacterium]